MSSRQSAPERAPSQPAPAPVPADVGIVAALPIEIGFLTDKLRKVRKYAGAKHSIIEGECAGKLVAVIVAGTGCDSARLGTELLLAGHHPRWVLSVGFGGALNPSYQRNQIVLATEVLDRSGKRFAIDVNVPAQGTNGAIVTGRLLTVDAIIRTAAEKAELRRQFDVDVVDMETLGVAEVCSARGVRFLSVRVISDDANRDLPPEVAALFNRSGSYMAGAALRALWHRPSSLKDFWTLHEHAQEAADRLANFVIGAIEQLA